MPPKKNALKKGENKKRKTPAKRYKYKISVVMQRLEVDEKGKKKKDKGWVLGKPVDVGFFSHTTKKAYIKAAFDTIVWYDWALDVEPDLNA